MFKVELLPYDRKFKKSEVHPTYKIRSDLYTEKSCIYRLNEKTRKTKLQVNLKLKLIEP